MYCVCCQCLAESCKSHFLWVQLADSGFSSYIRLALTPVSIHPTIISLLVPHKLEWNQNTHLSQTETSLWWLPDKVLRVFHSNFWFLFNDQVYYPDKIFLACMDLISWMENDVNGKLKAYKIATCGLSCLVSPSPHTHKHRTLPGFSCLWEAFSSLLSLLTKFKTVYHVFSTNCTLVRTLEPLFLDL